MAKEDNPSKFVTKDECAQISGDIKDELRTIRVALVGEDMRGGLVKDVADLKKERSSTVEVLKAVVVPIVVAVVSSATAAYILSTIH